MKLTYDDQSPMCLSATKTIDDLFFTCPFSATCLKELCNWLTVNL